MVFVDVDGLKQVNDVHGHQAGDELLALIGEVIRGSLRSYDMVVRYGGDEFVCAMPNLALKDARARFEKIAEVLALLDPKHGVSFGVAQAKPGESLHRLIIRADTDLLDVRSSRRRNRAGRSPGLRDEPVQTTAGNGVARSCILRGEGVGSSLRALTVVDAELVAFNADGSPRCSRVERQSPGAQEVIARVLPAALPCIGGSGAVCSSAPQGRASASSKSKR